MRWIVIALLLANIGLYAWFQTTGRSAPSPAVDNAVPREAGDPIVLVEEAPQNALREAPPVPEPKLQSGDLCTLLGPFEEEYLGEDIAQRLQALQVDAALREVEVQGQMRYWVFLAPTDSRREAFRKLRELQAAGIDSYVIPKGSLANGISFGIFSEPDRAESLAEELRQKGIDIRTREEPQTYLERWVVLPPGGAESLADDFWTQLQREYPELDRRQNLCSEVNGNL
jgi:cell division protein FtsN